MLIFVVITNLVISSISFYLAWRMGKLRLKLARFADDLNILANDITMILTQGEEILSLGVRESRRFRRNYDQIHNTIQQLRKILILVNLINKFYSQNNLKKSL